MISQKIIAADVQIKTFQVFTYFDRCLHYVKEHDLLTNGIDKQDKEENYTNSGLVFSFNLNYFKKILFCYNDYSMFNSCCCCDNSKLSYKRRIAEEASEKISAEYIDDILSDGGYYLKSTN